jgi:hypothetical protein
MNNFKNIIQSGITQRIVYAIILILYNIVFFKNGINAITTWQEFLSLESSFRVPYLYVWLIPSFLLLFQCVFNNKIGWFSLLIIYISTFIFRFVDFLIEMIEGYGVKYIESDFLLFIVESLFIFILIGFFIFLLKPKTNDSKENSV